MIDARILDMIRPDFENGPWIAGGAALSSYLGLDNDGADIDVWFKNSKQFDETLIAIKSKLTFGNFFNCPTIETGNAITFIGDNVQLIRMHFFDSLDDVFNSFDLTVCQVATDGKSFRFGKDTITHIKNKELHINNLKSASLKRIIKYQILGFNVPQSTIKLIEENYETLISNGVGLY